VAYGLYTGTKLVTLNDLERRNWPLFLRISADAMSLTLTTVT